MLRSKVSHFHFAKKEHVMPIRQFDSQENFVIKRANIGKNGARKLQSLAMLFSPQLRQQFSKKLFGGDVSGFDNFLAKLETAPNWSVAHHLLEQYFYRTRISPYNDNATQFSDIIYKRYFPKG
jgi:hypothetical protein